MPNHNNNKKPQEKLYLVNIICTVTCKKRCEILAVDVFIIEYFTI